MADDADDDLYGDDFGQKVDLTARIREILRDYPEGTSIFKELVQNADDAGARDVVFCLDCRRHPADSVWAPPMRAFQGPALLVYNSAMFTRRDFDSIQSIGNSLKREKGQAPKTGRFGVGFNSVYHLTDLPQFVSSRFVTFFDPQARSLPRVNPGNPGKIVDFVKNPEVVRRFADQFAPLRCFGCDLRQQFQGTLFRLPLRSPAQAAKSKLAQTPRTPENVWEQLQLFGRAGSSILLFLKKVERIRIMRWDEGAGQPAVAADVRIRGVDDRLRKLREYAGRAITTQGAAAGKPGRAGGGGPAARRDMPREVKVDYRMRIGLRLTEIGAVGGGAGARAERGGDGGDGGTDGAGAAAATAAKTAVDRSGAAAVDCEEEWVVHSQLGGGFRAHAISTDPQHEHLRLVPWAGVAACVGRTEGDGRRGVPSAASATNRTVVYPALVGAAYCFLPLPVQTGLPFHVNGYFELSSNRRDVLHGDDLQGVASSRAQWNEALLDEIAAPCLLRLVATEAARLGKTATDEQLEGYYRLFPASRHADRAPWNGLVSAFYAGVSDPGMRLLHSRVRGGRWIGPSHAVVLPPSPAAARRRRRASLLAARENNARRAGASERGGGGRGGGGGGGGDGGTGLVGEADAAATPRQPTGGQEAETKAQREEREEDEAYERKRQRLVTVMLTERVCVVACPDDLATALLDWHRVCRHRLDAPTVCRHFAAGGEHPALADRDNAVFLFDFLVTSRVERPLLVGLPLVPLLGGGVGRLSAPARIDIATDTHVAELRGMGFSLQLSVCALHQGRGVEPIEWLMGRGSGSERGAGGELSPLDDWRGAPIFVPPSPPTAAGPAGTGGDGAAATPHQLLQRLLGFPGSRAARAILDGRDLSRAALERLATDKPKGECILDLTNLLRLTPARLALLLPEVYPPEWSGVLEVERWTPADPKSKAAVVGNLHPSRAWISVLWDYLFTRPAQIGAHFDGLAFVPTAQGTLSRLRPSMPVLLAWPSFSSSSLNAATGDGDDAEAVAAAQASERKMPTTTANARGTPAELRLSNVLTGLGVRTVDRSLFPGDQGETVRILSPNYLQLANRGGVLRALDAVRSARNAADFNALFRLCDVQPEHVRLLRMFVQREGARTITPWERQALRGMPLFLCPAGRSGGSAGAEAFTSVEATPTFIESVAAVEYGLDAATLGPVLPTNVIAAETPQEEELLRALGARPLPFATFLCQSFLPRLGSGPGVRGFGTLPEVAARDRVIVTVLSNFAALCRADAALEPMLRSSAFVPTVATSTTSGGGASTLLSRACDLYDPDAEDIAPLLDGSQLPALALLNDPKTRNGCLLVLRQLGLRSVLSREAVLRVAQSIQTDAAAAAAAPATRTSGANTPTPPPRPDAAKASSTEAKTQARESRGNDSDRNDGESALERADLLVRYLDVHSNRLFDVDDSGAPASAGRRARERKERLRRQQKTTSFLSRAVGSVTGASAAAAQQEADALAEEKRQNAADAAGNVEFVNALMGIAWVPVVTSCPFDVPAGFPWKGSVHPAAVLRPHETRPMQDLWHCSALRGLVDTPVLSPALRHVLGWNRPVPAVVIATQLVRLGAAFSSWHVGESTGGSGGARPSQSLLAQFATKLPQLYAVLDTAMFEAPSAKTTPQRHPAAIRAAVGNILRGAKWVWVDGTGSAAFVESERLAFRSDLLNVDCSPFLLSVPRHLRALSPAFQDTLKSLGARERFGAADFAQVLKDIRILQQQQQQRTAKPKNPRGEDGGNNGVALTPRLLGLCISLVQTLSDSNAAVVEDLEIFVPDEKCLLRPAPSLHFNDVPWIPRQAKKGGASSSGAAAASHVPGIHLCRFVHPKISNVVARKLGVRSLRESMIDAEYEDLHDFSSSSSSSSSSRDKLGDDVDAQAFGQGEPLTRRLRGIIELYPEGTQVLAEFLQNADDAGASEFCLMLNRRSYGERSLLSTALGELQGPALYCYNNAVFRPHDFENLARLGQGSKLSKLTTTGRFGLGFNSAYHYTSVPSFVSGDHVVFFDPHTRYCPRATTQRPGLKLRFTQKTSRNAAAASVPLCERFEDQFAPYCFFGCDMRKRFEGTLFRLPLRNERNVENDEIKPRACPAETIEHLLESFRSVAVHSLLFLRNVKRIRIFVVDEDASDAGEAKRNDGAVQASAVALDLTDLGTVTQPPTASDHSASAPRRRTPRRSGVSGDHTQPVLLFEARVSKRDEKQWKAVPAFLSGAKDAVFTKLKNTPEKRLPRSTQVVEITSRAMTFDANGRQHAAVDGADGASAQVTDEFLISQCIGAGAARDLACDPKSAHLKLIPWGGVAAHLSHTVVSDGSGNSGGLQRDGRAFCFLPLPVMTKLPVHVNAYFELSSNRRDIWRGGEDMRGEASQRAAWNRLVISDAIVPAYVDLLCACRDLRSDAHRQQLMDLFPTLASVSSSSSSASSSESKQKTTGSSMGTAPGRANDIWSLVVTGVYERIRNVPLLRVLPSSSPGSSQPRWLRPSEVVLMDESDRDAARLRRVLLQVGLPIVSVTRPQLRQTLVHTGCVSREVSPSEIRRCLRAKADGLVVESSRSSSAQGSRQPLTTSRAAVTTISRRAALFLLHYCCTDNKLAELVGVPLLPLSDGTFCKFAPSAAASPVFLTKGTHEVNLLSDSLPQMLVDPAVLAVAERKARAGKASEDAEADKHQLVEDRRIAVVLRSPPVTSATQVTVLTPTLLRALFRLTMPDSSKGKDEVLWTGEGPRRQPPREWVRRLWAYLERNQSSLDKFGAAGSGVASTFYPLLPTRQPRASTLMSLRPGMAALRVDPRAAGLRRGRLCLGDFDSDENDETLLILRGLCRVGVRCIDPELVPTNFLDEEHGEAGSAGSSKGGGNDTSSSPTLFSSYVQEPTPKGVLESIANALGGLDLRMHARARERFTKVPRDEVDALRVFLLSDQGWQQLTSTLPMTVDESTSPFFEGGSSRMTSFHKAVMIRLPIFELHTGSNGRDVSPLGALLLSGPEAATAVAGSPNASPCRLLPPSDGSILPALLSEDFLDTGDNPITAQQLRALGCRTLKRAQFYVDHFFPRLSAAADSADAVRAAAGNDAGVDRNQDDAGFAASRDRQMESVLKEMGGISIDDPRFTDTLRETRFVPNSNGVLHAPRDLYDPAVASLHKLLDETCFPHGRLAKPGSLMSLRQLGLRRDLPPQGLLRSVESVCRASAAGQHEAAFERAVVLTEFLQSMVLGASRDGRRRPRGSAQEQTAELAEIERVLGQIRQLPWMPVMVQPPFAELPWPTATPLAGSLPRLVSPVDARPQEDMWLCSSQRRLLDNRVARDLQRTCPIVAHAFGWSTPLPPAVLALQVRALAAAYNMQCVVPMASAAPTVAAVAATADASTMDKKALVDQESAQSIPVAQAVAVSASSAAAAVASTAAGAERPSLSSSAVSQQHRGHLGGGGGGGGSGNRAPAHLVRLQRSLPKLYEALLEALEAEDAVEADQDGSASSSSSAQETVAAILSTNNAGAVPWVWVGTRFAPTRQCAFECPAQQRGSSRHLHEIPADMAASFGPLFRRMGVRQRFGNSDFLSALLSLWRDNGGQRGKASQPLAKTDVDFAITLVGILAEAVTAARGIGRESAGSSEAKNSTGDDAKEDEEEGRGGAKRSVTAAAAAAATTTTEDGEQSGSRLIKMIASRTLVPDESMCLCAASTMVYDDAPWLSSQVQNRRAMHFVHPSISHATAQAVGVRSLRRLLLSNRIGDDFPFPVSIRDVTTLLRSYNHAERLLSDGCVHVADMLRVGSCEIVLDTRQHPAESLMNPAMAALQGPALLLRFPQAPQLNFERLRALLAHPNSCASCTPDEMRLRCGAGSCFSGPLRLLSLFSVADCLTIVSGGSLFTVDPLNTLNKVDDSRSAADESTPPTKRRHPGQQQQQKAVSEYQFLRSSLRRRFPDMFAPFLPPGADAPPLGQPLYDGLLIRVPFRLSPSSISDTVLGSNDIKHMISRIENAAPSALVFSVFAERLAVKCIGRSAAMTIAAMRGRTTEVLRHMSASGDHMPASTPAPAHPLDLREAVVIQCSVDASASVQGLRREIEENSKWFKGGIMRFFSGGQGQAQVSSRFALRIKCRTGSPDVSSAAASSKTSSAAPAEASWVDEWDVSLGLATGETKDMALSDRLKGLIQAGVSGRPDDVYDPQLLSPAMGLAAHVRRGTGPAPLLDGRFCCGSAMGDRCGLPFHVMGRFEWGACKDANDLRGGLPLHDAVSVAGAGAGTVGGGRTMTDMERLGAEWNKGLVEEIFSTMVLEMLDRLRLRFTREGVPGRLYNFWPLVAGTGSNDAAGVGNADATTDAARSSAVEAARQLVPAAAFFQSLAARELFWSHSRKAFVRLGDGLFPSHAKSCTPRVLAFSETVFAMLSGIPGAAAWDFEKAGVSVRTLNPAQIRRFVMQDQHKSRLASQSAIVRCAEAVEVRTKAMRETMSGGSVSASGAGKEEKHGHDHGVAGATDAVALLAADLLAFALSDLSVSDAGVVSSVVGRHLGGLRLLPLADGTLAALPNEQEHLPLDRAAVFAASDAQEALLPGSVLVHPCLAQTLSKAMPHLHGLLAAGSGTSTSAAPAPNALAPPARALLHSLGVVEFSPSVLAAHISKALPLRWRNELIVAWEPGVDGAPSWTWMKTFWSIVDVNDVAAVRLFDAWPLVPLKGSELMSCSLLEAAVLTGDDADEDERLRQAVEKESQLAPREESTDDRLAEETLTL